MKMINFSVRQFLIVIHREREREREFFYYSDKYINIYNELNIKHFVPSPIGLICHFKASMCQCVAASTNKSRKMLHNTKIL